MKYPDVAQNKCSPCEIPETLDSKKRSLIDSILRETQPEALEWIRKAIEDVLGKSWRKRLEKGLIFVLGVLVCLLLEEIKGLFYLIKTWLGI